MTAYCKHCHCSHSAWNRLNDGYICGLCHTRERDPQVIPVNATSQTGTARNHQRRQPRSFKR